MNDPKTITARQDVQVDGKWFKRGQSFAVAAVVNLKTKPPAIDRWLAGRWCALGWAAWEDDVRAARVVEAGRKA